MDKPIKEKIQKTKTPEIGGVEAIIYKPTEGKDPKTGRTIDTTKPVVMRFSRQDWMQFLVHGRGQGWFIEKVNRCPKDTPRSIEEFNELKNKK